MRNYFWNHKIKNLGPRDTKYIPVKVIDTIGNIFNNDREVLNKWQIDFQNVCNDSVNTDVCFVFLLCFFSRSLR
jgi:hypothetical protein